MPCRHNLCSNLLLMKNAINERPMYEKAMALIDRLHRMVGAYQYINQRTGSSGEFLHSGMYNVSTIVSREVLQMGST
jgi:hypothetical protein